MDSSLPKYYYLFKGNWKDRFEELENMVRNGKISDFELWVPKDKHRNHHIIVAYGKPLTLIYSLVKNVWETSPSVFTLFYALNHEHYIIHKTDTSLEQEKGKDVAKDSVNA